MSVYDRFCPYCSKYCKVYDSLIFYDNHGNYLGNDYFLPSKYRSHYELISKNKLFEAHIIRTMMVNYELVSDKHNLEFTFYGNVWEKLCVIDIFEMHFYKPVFEYNQKIIYIKNELLTRKKQVAFHYHDDFQFDIKQGKKRIKNCEPIHGAIYRMNYSQKLDLTVKGKFTFNKEISYVYLFNDEFSLNIFEEYINGLPPTAIALIRLFVGSTRYMIRNIMKRNLYFSAMKRFNNSFMLKAQNNFKKRQLAAKEYIPTKFKKTPKVDEEPKEK